LKDDKTYAFTLDAIGKHWDIKFDSNAKQHSLFAVVSKDVVNTLATDSRGLSFTLRNGDKVIGRYTLDNSAKAIRDVMHCAREHPHPVNTKATPDPNIGEKGPSFGTGFFVADHYILTNWHVVKGACTKVYVKYPDYRPVPAFIQGHDETNDLVLLKTEMSDNGVATFRFMPKLGEQVASYGFPYGGQLVSTSGNFTIGNITATTGLKDDSRSIQMSTPIQPGNSGGPLLDAGGQVLGVTEMQLGAFAMAEATGTIPQNVNFAISSAIAVNFLMIKGIEPKLAINIKNKLAPEELADVAKKFTVQVYCE
jgi:serine protease Do